VLALRTINDQERGKGKFGVRRKRSGRDCVVDRFCNRLNVLYGRARSTAAKDDYTTISGIEM
jgi:hypothetical protein